MMTPSDEQKLNAIRGKVDRYQFGKTIEVAANMKFLLEVIEKLQAEIVQLKSRESFPLDERNCFHFTARMDAPFIWEKLSQTAIRLNGELIQTDSFSICNRMVEILEQNDALRSVIEQQHAATDALHNELTDIYNQLRTMKEGIDDFRSNVMKLTTEASIQHVKDKPR